MKSLDQIGVECGTDKSSLNHNYLNFYEKLLIGLHYPYRMLEIGIQFGNSLKTWREYWPNAIIFGIDSVDNGFTDPSVTLFFGDAYSLEMTRRLEPNKFDIIIDDGSHDPAHQRWFVETYRHLLAPHGLLIVEDVEPSTYLTAPDGFQSVTATMNEGHSTAASRLFITWERRIK